VDEDILREKLALFVETFKSENWKKQTTKNGIEVFVWDAGSHSGIKAGLEVPYNNEVVMKVLSNPEIPFKANFFGDYLEELEDVGPTSKFIYMRFKGLLMVAGRDFVTFNTITNMENPNDNSNTPVIVSFSHHHPKEPAEVKGTVRGELVIAGWICTKVDKDTTFVQNFAVNDLKGSIPKFVTNSGASYHAQIFTNLKKKLDEMKKEGTLPVLKT
jgi:hypothetical protein